MALQDTLEKLNNIDLSDIDFDRIGTWPLAGKVFLAVLVCCVIIGLGYFLQVKDLQEQYERAVKEEATLKSSFRRKAHDAANLEAYREQMAEIDESFSALLSQLPSDTEVPGLLEDITERASQSGLKINRIDLQPEVVGEFYVELPIKISVEGSYHDFGGFVSGIAGLPRIVTLHDYDIASDEGLLTMNIDAKTYRYKSPDESDSAKPSGQAIAGGRK